MICKFCNKFLKNAYGLNAHLVIHGINIQKYYDLYYKKEEEEKCRVCGKKTAYINFSKGYRLYCSYKCSCKRALEIKNSFLKEKLLINRICGLCGKTYKPCKSNQKTCSKDCSSKIRSIKNALPKKKEYFLNNPLKYSEKTYYDIFFKKQEEGKCLKCSSPTAFKNINDGYKLFCSTICRASYAGRISAIKSPHWEVMWRASVRRLKGKTYEELYGIKEAQRKKELLSFSHKGFSPSESTRKKQSLLMKEKIFKGEFTPKSTNRYTHAKLFLKVKDKEYHCRSTWEVKFIQFLFSLNIDDVGFEELRIPYFDKENKKYRIYIVDFYLKKYHLVFELKPKRIQKTLNAKCKDAALLIFCKKNSLKRILVSEKDVINNFRRIKKYVKNY